MTHGTEFSKSIKLETHALPTKHYLDRLKTLISFPSDEKGDLWNESLERY